MNKEENTFLTEKLAQLRPTSNNPLYIGRQQGDDDPRIPYLIDYTPDIAVSRYQAELWFDGPELYILDRNSSNGTFVNEHNIRKRGPWKLNNSDIIQFSKYQYIIRTDESDSIRKVGNDNVAHNVSENDSLMKVIKDHYPSKDNPLHIGRRFQGDTRYPFFDLSHNEKVSRKHAIVWIENDQIFIEDTKSVNGTFVNNINIQYQEATSLKPGDMVSIGNTTYAISNIETAQSSPEKPKIKRAIPTLLQLHKVEKIDKRFVFKNDDNKLILNWRIKHRLQQTSIRIEKNDFVVIMGPSGCGKSTVLKIMCGEITHSTGQVVYTIDKQHRYLNSKDWKIINKRIGYVPQKDILHSELTVYDELKYSAKMRMGKDSNSGAIPDSKIDERINEVLSQLNIEGCRNKQIHSISGGQAKRVSIALEILTKPEILFLDEPTSPLDPGAVDDLLDTLKQLNDSGTTIVMVSHKQEDLKFSSKVMFLGVGGYQVYYDESGEKLYNTFGVKNPQEIYKIISNVDEAEKLQHEHLEHKKTKGIAKVPDEIKTYKTIPRSGAIPQNSLIQFWILTQRLFTERRKKTGNFLFQLFGLPLILALVVTGINHQVEIVLLFWSAITAIFIGINGSMGAIINEIDIYNREKMTVIKNGPYLFSKLAYAIVVSFIQALVVSAVFWVKFDYLNEDIPLFNMDYFFLFYWYLIISASILGLLLSAYVKTMQLSFYFLPILLVLQIIFSGVIAPIESKGMEVASYFSISRWGTEGFARIQNKLYGEDTLYIDTAGVRPKTISNVEKDDYSKVIPLRFDKTLYIVPKNDNDNSNEDSTENADNGKNKTHEYHEQPNQMSGKKEKGDLKEIPAKVSTQPSLYQVYSKDTANQKDTVIFKTIYKDIKVRDTNRYYLQDSSVVPLMSDKRESIQISVWEALPFVNDKKLLLCFNSWWNNILALSLLNLICLFLAWYFLIKKSNI